MIQVVYSTEHWIVPIITMGVLVVLLAAIILTEGRARVQEGKPFFQKPGRFFLENYDKMKLWGTLLLFAGYIFALDVIGFTVTSLIFVFLFNVLYTGTSKKALIGSAVIAVVASLLISVMFGIVFNITLPSVLDHLCRLRLYDLLRRAGELNVAFYHWHFADSGRRDGRRCRHHIRRDPRHDRHHGGCSVPAADLCL